jgi:hypothetical protein
VEEKLIEAYRFFIRNWNALLAAASLIGVAIVAFAPPLQEYTKVFVFAAANAVVWTLIEIKVQLSPHVKKQRFPNMRSARSAIIKEIMKAADDDETLELGMIGGRIRSMTDVAREAITTLCNKGSKCEAVKINIQCMAPDYLKALLLPGKLASDTQAERNAMYATAVEGFTKELKYLVAQPAISTRCSLDITFYNSPPFVYCYIIGTRAIVWGFFTWSQTEADFEGPENACFLQRKGDPGFAETRAWLINRMNLNKAIANTTALSPGPI